MKRFIRIGVDLGKNYFQVHALTSEGGQARTRKLSRQAMRKFFSEIEPCLVGMEACASSHYWAREPLAAGHDVRLIPPIFVKPYVKRGKNDAADAEAICEAMSRPGMRFVPVKSANSQAALMLHKTRELLVKQKTMSVNALRSHLSEFGIIIAKGIGRAGELLELAEKDAALPNAARGAAKVPAGQIAGLDKLLNDLEEEIAAAHKASEMSRYLIEVPGIGKLIAAAIVASLPDPGGVQKKGAFCRLAWPAPAAKLKRRQADARSHHQAGQPIHKEAARAWDNLDLKQRGQAQGSVARLDCRALGEKAGAEAFAETFAKA